MDTYSVSTLDDDGTVLIESGLTLWQIRPVLRELYRCGWSPMSIQVKAETHEIEAARWNRGYVAERNR